MGHDVMGGRRARGAAALVVAVALTTAACGGAPDGRSDGSTGAPTAPTAAGGTTAVSGTASPTTTPTRGTTVAPDRVTLVFAVGGGCYDTAEPVGCGPSEPVVVADADTRALLAARAAKLAALPLADPSVGCGGEFVDGASVRVTVDVATGDDVTSHLLCLSDAPTGDPAVAALWSLDPRAP